MSEPPWREEGFEGLKLAYLAAQSGFFYDKHRALHDCHATLELLARPLPASGPTALAHLLERARRPSFRLWAEGAPFDHKDTLKGRSYRWSGGEDGRPRAWWSDLAEDALDAEVAFLREHVFAFEVEPLSGGSAPTTATPSEFERPQGQPALKILPCGLAQSGLRRWAAVRSCFLCLSRASRTACPVESERAGPDSRRRIVMSRSGEDVTAVPGSPPPATLAPSTGDFHAARLRRLREPHTYVRHRVSSDRCSWR